MLDFQRTKYVRRRFVNIVCLDQIILHFRYVLPLLIHQMYPKMMNNKIVKMICLSPQIDQLLKLVTLMILMI